MKAMQIAMPSVSLALLLCLGCGHQMMTVDVNGTRKTETPIPSHVTYAVFPTTEVETDPAFPTYAKMVAKKMEERGYRKSSERTANLGVFLAYGMHEGSSQAGAAASGPGMGMGGGGGIGPGSSGPSTYGVAGSPPGAGGYRSYTAQLVLVVVDLQKSRTAGTPVELWRGETRSSVNSKDLSQAAPMLVEAAFKHFGETTPNKVQHTFGEEDLKKLQEAK